MLHCSLYENAYTHMILEYLFLGCCFNHAVDNLKGYFLKGLFLQRRHMDTARVKLISNERVSWF